MKKPKKIFISNRLPFSIDLKTKSIKKGSGGLVSALLGVNLEDPFFWMGFETDIESAKKIKNETPNIIPHIRVNPVLVDKKTYDQYYDGFCNDVIWPLFHYESQHAFFKRSDWQAYVACNRIMADEVLKIAEPQDTIWIHDFHFLLLPKMLRQGNSNLKIGLFLHTPFPSSEIFRQLPVREQILNGMIQSNLIGFHEHSYLRHFTVSLKAHLGIDSTFFKAEVGDHDLHLGVYPISIDVEKWKNNSLSENVLVKSQILNEKIKIPFLILGVDRLDYTKGLELKLHGFRRFLQKYPDLRGRVSLLQIAVPTRTQVPSYIRLKKEVDELVGMINGEFAEPGYAPIHYIFNSLSEDELLTLYKRADCLLITSKRDGMNLVAIEYAISQDKSNPGVLIVSEFAGAASLLGQALIINPWDEDSIAEAIKSAYDMPVFEKIKRVKSLHVVLSQYSATQWALGYLKDLEAASSRTAKSPVVRLEAMNQYQSLDLFQKIMQAPKCLLVMDYDGTLVGIKSLPEFAILPNNLRTLIYDLGNYFSILIISGRDKEFLDEQFEDCDVTLAAEHGAFYRTGYEPWKSRVSSDIQSWFSEVKKVMKAYSETVPLSFVECKEASLVWHFRQSPTDFASFRAKKLDEELQVGLANQPVSVTIGSKIVEAKAVECHKGSFLKWILEHENFQDVLTICLGDDRTDEDMFKVLDQRGVSIKVGPGVTSAQYRLAGQEDVISFLKEVLNRKQADSKQNKIILHKKNQDFFKPQSIQF